MYSQPNANYYQQYQAQPSYGAPAPAELSKQPYNASGNAYGQPATGFQSAGAAAEQPGMYFRPISAAGYEQVNGPDQSVLSGEDVQVMNESTNVVNGNSNINGSQNYHPNYNSDYSQAQPSYTQPYAAPSAYPRYEPATYANQQNQQQPYGQNYAPQPQQSPATFSGGYNTSGGDNAGRSRRLDPDSLPNVLQVLRDDGALRAGVYRTGERGQVPPLSLTLHTNCVTEDGGLSGPRFVRATMNTVPTSNDLAKQVGLPLGLVVTPLARLPSNEWPAGISHVNGVPLASAIESGNAKDGPLRCVRCKAYISPLMQFIEGGRRFTCPLCSADSDVPEHYFAHLDHTGKRVDSAFRPELRFGTFELPTSIEYCRNNQQPEAPAFVFVLDASYQSLHTGLLQIVCARLRDDVLLRLPSEGGEPSRVRVGFITYTSTINFHTFDMASGKPRTMIVSDLEDVFIPSLLNLLVPVDTQTLPMIEMLLRELPKQVASMQSASEPLLGPALQAGLAVFQGTSACGRLVVLHTGLPTADVPGKLTLRDERKATNAEKTRQLLTPASTYYTKLAEQFVGSGVGVDLFLFPNAYCDIATLSEISRITGGNVYRYPNFQAALDGERFMNDLRMMIERPCGFDAVMRVRCSGGVRAFEFFGNLHMQNANDVELGLVDSEKSIGVEIRYDDKLTEAEGCFMQIALLYTSVSGQRRVRVMNMSFNVSTNLTEVYKGIDTDAMVNLVTKMANRSLLTKSTQEIEHQLTSQCIHALACYRKHCSPSGAAGQLILPEALKVYPQLLNGALKSGALRGCTEPTIDDRSHAIFQLHEMTDALTVAYFYPRVIPLHFTEPNQNGIPEAIRCAYERLQNNGAYLLENGLLMFLWIGQACNPEFLSNIFGVNFITQLGETSTAYELPALDNPLSARVRQIVTMIREQRSRHMKLVIVKQRGQLESLFQHYFVEDQCPDGMPAYVDYLMLLHKEIRSQLS